MGRRLIAADISVADFDPNVSLGSHKFYLVYNGRTLSLRRTRAPAITDFSDATHAKLYEWDPSVPGWVLIAYKDDHATYCDRCGLTTFDWPKLWNYSKAQYEQVTTKPQEDLGKWAFERRRGKLATPLTCQFMCQTCREDHG